MTYHDDGLPDEAFTELERAAGVPVLLRASDSQPLNLPATEIEPTVGRDELLAVLVDGICNGGLDVRVQCQIRTSPHGVYELSAFDECPDAPLPNLYLRIAHDFCIPVTFLIDVIRTSGVPLLSDEGWLAWDARDQRLKHNPPCVEDLWHRARAKRPEESMDERELHLMRLLRRAVLSTDHGKKPLMLQREFLDDAMLHREVEFEDPCRIHGDAVDRYMLAFYASAGKAASFPLAQAAKLGFPIVTRNSAYMWRDHDFVPLLSNAKLLTGAFLIATKFNPNEFQWFLARERGTLFQSAIERVEAPRDPRAPLPSPWFSSARDSQRRTYVTWEGEDALSIATNIIECASELGAVYLTVDGHPLDVDFVTTPVLYRQAIRILNSFGYAIQYNLGPGVRLEKS
jgi:hypothetical protein